MLCRDTMPRAHNPALKQAECRLYRVCADRDVLLAHVLIGTVIDALMTRLMVCSELEIVEFGFIGHDDIDGRIHVAGNDVVNGLLVHVLSLDKVEMAAALTNADDRSLVLKLALVTALLSADVGFVNLDCAGEFVPRFGHRSADSVTEVPCSLVGDAKHSLDLICRHSLTRFAQQVRSSKPLWQRQVGIVEDSPGHYRELVAA